MRSTNRIALPVVVGLSLAPLAAHALESDRKEPLEVQADATDGTLGDGITTLTGQVEIHQGTLLIKAEQAEVEKLDGKVRKVTLRGDAAYLEQEIEEQGLVKAWADRIEYHVGSGMVVFSGDAEVRHPQYEIRGDLLRYDLNVQHFQGHGGEEGGGRIQIRLDPEVVPQAVEDASPATSDAPGDGDAAED
ncbi:MAG: lipopolysaccharide transport periplasmic protein LptA [Xanthomonadales bacterium]|nr:lipopolysaccharide transport periplasmic protein LptA [Xanthomonadales bacterium]NIN59048.1 lipopolysaccharide transport periplasmic protein LptA [Xanthomonadales bacterium]NIN74352.1 lipopolysaccharide transport periplasmic protein LptA [Xanthomonadales bacterium]NIO13937.1 lipopolysaccharide transport periplasmic protein LptA [Xanthomonadales bacterium]NIP11441.1 lipopolysaccharide transport periplasmic protein LptA [Xanthomonadales bacterium]